MTDQHTLERAYLCLARLVYLKDNKPQDYDAQKEIAWHNAREIVSGTIVKAPEHPVLKGIRRWVELTPEDQELLEKAEKSFAVNGG